MSLNMADKVLLLENAVRDKGGIFSLLVYYRYLWNVEKLAQQRRCIRECIVLGHPALKYHIIIQFARFVLAVNYVFRSNSESGKCNRNLSDVVHMKMLN